MKKIIIPIVSLLIMAGCTPTPDEKVKPVSDVNVETFIDSSIDGTKESQEYLDSQLKD